MHHRTAPRLQRAVQRCLFTSEHAWPPTNLNSIDSRQENSRACGSVDGDRDAQKALCKKCNRWFKNTQCLLVHLASSFAHRDDLKDGHGRVGEESASEMLRAGDGVKTEDGTGSRSDREAAGADGAVAALPHTPAADEEYRIEVVNGIEAFWCVKCARPFKSRHGLESHWSTAAAHFGGKKAPKGRAEGTGMQPAAAVSPGGGGGGGGGGRADEDKIMCEECNVSFKSLHALRVHLLVSPRHTGGKKSKLPLPSRAPPADRSSPIL